MTTNEELDGMDGQNSCELEHEQHGVQKHTVSGVRPSNNLGLRQLLAAYITRYCGASSPRLFIKTFLLNPAFRPVVTLRCCQSADSSKAGWRLLLPILKVAHQFAKRTAGIDMPWRTSIGPGLLIAHGYGLVINERAVIGSNVTLFHGVTLGRRDRIAADGSRSSGYPILEDDVWCGPHAIIVGGAVIGQGSRIAGGAFVSSSIPPGSLVIGNPSQIVKSNVEPDVINRAVL